MIRRQAEGEKGFVITLELVLIFSILGIGLLVAMVAIRNALFVWWQKKQAHTVWVYDSSLDGTGASAPKVLGPVRDFDEHETPRLFYIDRTLSGLVAPQAGLDDGWLGHNFRAFIGVRDDRFTSRHRLFYQNTDCTSPDPGGEVCIARAGVETDDNLGVGSVPNSDTGDPQPIVRGGGIGYLYPLQGGPSYGIGRDIDTLLTGFPGTLYRETTLPCSTDLIQSKWTSQSVGNACELFTIAADVAAAFCPKGRNNSGAEANWCTAENCICWQNGVPCTDGPPNCGGACEPCSCPDGWYRATGENGNNCCPIGTEFDQQAGECRGAQGGLVQAVPVPNPSDTGNALAGFTPPFRVNLPPDPSQFFLTEPGGFEGAPALGSKPYDPAKAANMNFNVPPDGENP